MDPLTNLSVRERLEQTGKIYGVVTAIVTSVNDPRQQRHGVGDVQVYFPWLQDRNDPALINPWARLVRTETGDNAGMCVFPQVDDEVICAFEHGDIHHPYVIGGVWNNTARCPNPSADDTGGNPPPKARCGGAAAGEPNKTWLMRSRSGHKILFDDENKHITVESATGSTRMELCDGGTCEIRIINTSGPIHIEARDDINITSTQKSINMKAAVDINMEAGNNINYKAGCAVSGQAGTTASLQAGTSISETAGTSISNTAGTTYSVTAGASGTITCGASISITSGAAMTITSGAAYTLIVAAGMTTLCSANVLFLAGGNWLTMVGGNILEMCGGNRLEMCGGNAIFMVGGNVIGLDGGNDFEIGGGIKGEIFGGISLDIFGGLGIDIFGGIKIEISAGLMIEISAAMKLELTAALNIELAGAPKVELSAAVINLGGFCAELSGATIHGTHPSGGIAPVGW